MLTHIVCWKYKSETTAEQQADHIAMLKNLANIIEEVETLNAGADVLKLDRSFDTGLVATYADQSALDAYNAHPEHQKVAAFGREIAEKTISVDFIDD